MEIHAGGHREKSGDESETEAELQFKYGLTGDWVAGIGSPYVSSGDVDDRWGSTNLST